MKIDILTRDGSPLEVTSKTMWGDSKRIGLGGAEYALITMCEEWTKRGHQVTLYNNPLENGVSPFEQRLISDFKPEEDRDIFITFRSPSPPARIAKGKRVWWSCDQYTTLDYAQYTNNWDKIVCISPAHQAFFAATYNITNTLYIDLPVRLDDFESALVKKVPKRVIFTSVPARGLDNLMRIWPKLVREVPDASLVITSDYRLWGVGASNEHFRVAWMGKPNYVFMGALPRKQYIEELMKAEMLLYPSNYEEMFCIAVAEAACVGAYPVTSTTGALPTTNMGQLLDLNADDPHNDRAFLEAAVYLLNNHEILEHKAKETAKVSRERFDPENIAKQWEEKAFE